MIQIIQLEDIATNPDLWKCKFREDGLGQHSQGPELPHSLRLRLLYTRATKTGPQTMATPAMQRRQGPAGIAGQSATETSCVCHRRLPVRARRGNPKS
jgi:hypothetical protein